MFTHDMAWQSPQPDDVHAKGGIRLGWQACRHNKALPVGAPWQLTRRTERAQAVKRSMLALIVAPAPLYPLNPPCLRFNSHLADWTSRAAKRAEMEARSAKMAYRLTMSS